MAPFCLVAGTLLCVGGEGPLLEYRTASGNWKATLGEEGELAVCGLIAPISVRVSSSKEEGRECWGEGTRYPLGGLPGVGLEPAVEPTYKITPPVRRTRKGEGTISKGTVNSVRKFNSRKCLKISENPMSKKPVLWEMNENNASSCEKMSGNNESVVGNSGNNRSSCGE